MSKLKVTLAVILMGLLFCCGCATVPEGAEPGIEVQIGPHQYWVPLPFTINRNQEQVVKT